MTGSSNYLQAKTRQLHRAAYTCYCWASVAGLDRLLPLPIGHTFDRSESTPVLLQQLHVLVAHDERLDLVFDLLERRRRLGTLVLEQDDMEAELGLDRVPWCTCHFSSAGGFANSGTIGPGEIAEIAALPCSSRSTFPWRVSRNPCPPSSSLMIALASSSVFTRMWRALTSSCGVIAAISLS